MPLLGPLQKAAHVPRNHVVAKMEAHSHWDLVRFADTQGLESSQPYTVIIGPRSNISSPPSSCIVYGAQENDAAIHAML